MVKGRRLLGIAALCVLSGSGWVLRQEYPSDIGWLFAASIHYALIGCEGLGFAAMGEFWKGCSARRLLALCGAGLCVFLVPTAALEFAAGKVPEFTGVAVFCIVPLMTVLAASSFGIEADEAARFRGLIMPSVVGLGGALLLFPVSNPGSVQRWLFFGLVIGSCVAVAAASVWMHRLMQTVGIGAALSVVGLSCSVVLGLYGVSVGWPVMGAKAIAGELLRGVALDLPEVCLLVWLMREITPARLSARFLLVPLVTVVEGYTVERGPVHARAILAVVLIGAGGAMLLFKDEPDEIPGLQLR